MASAAPSSLALASSASPALAIADVRYLWSEVDRLKAQVQQLQHSERVATDEQVRLRAYVASFVTQAQLEAALCTKISQSSVTSAVERVRVELADALEKKADADAVQVLQTKKLDISVYEASAWDLKKFRTALEQSVHDLFAGFAHQMEAQVNAKLSIDDFDRIFNPEANGQKAAIETAAARIARMNDQLESLQEYVASDRQRQHKLADLNVSLLDLTRKHNAARNSIAQVFSTLEASKERVAALEAEHRLVGQGFDATRAQVEAFESRVGAATAHQHAQVEAMRGDVDALQRASQQATQALAQIQQFTQHSLLKSVDAKFERMHEQLGRELEQLQSARHQFRKQSTQQLNSVSERVVQTLDQHAQLEARLRRLESLSSSLRDELAAVKGPLMTEALHLREENVAILEEIRRSQDESRELMIDYRGLVEKEAQHLQLQYPYQQLPSRPASSAGGSGSGGGMHVGMSAASRRHKQQHLLAMTARIGGGTRASNNGEPSNRPQTSAERVVRGASPQSSRTRARTAGPTPKAPPRPSTTASAQVAAANSASDHGEFDERVPVRPRSEAGARPTKSLLYSMATPARPVAGSLVASESTTSASSSSDGFSSIGAADDDQLFTFPLSCFTTNWTEHTDSKSDLVDREGHDGNGGAS